MSRYFGIGTALVVTALSCGGQSSRSEPGAGGELDDVESPDGCADFARVMCERRSECAPPTNHSGRRFADEAQCAERYSLACQGWLGFRGTTVSAGDLGRCGGELSEASCSRVLTLFHGYSADLPWCLPAGTLSNGETCATSAQCASGLCKPTETCGMCGSPSEYDLTRRYEGEPCVTTTDCSSVLECVDGVCQNTGCRELGCRDYGGTCGGFGQPPFCELGGDCKNQNDLGRGTCLGYAREGEACGDWEGATCLFPARCMNKSCVLPTPDTCQ